MNMNMNMHRPPARRAVLQAGFTLIEMLISITIGLGILAGLVGVLASTSSNSRSNDRTSELLSNGRYALNSMKMELREAGFRGYTKELPEAMAPGALGAPPNANECLQAGAAAGMFLANIRQGVWGSDNAAGIPNPFAANCLPAAAAGNDILVVRRVAPFPTAALAANTLYFQSTYDRGQVFRGNVAPTFGGTPLASFALQEFVYYISPVTNVTTPENPAIPALRRLALNGVGALVDELVASGIEHLQVQYGYVETDNTIRYFNAGQGNLTGDSFTATDSGWDRINSVRIWLVARNSAVEPGYVNNNTYTMGGQDFVKADNFRRQLFSTVVQLRN